MHFERKDFGATCFRDSFFIYVFGGTVGIHAAKDNKLIERYNIVSNTWEVLDVKLEEEFNPFITLSVVIKDQGREVSEEKEKILEPEVKELPMEE